jgi:hypothetical protein
LLLTLLLFSKYFKMLKAKVPSSWVKRVLEVDGKDGRVLDLDPDQPLADQLPEGAVDELGNVDWDKVNPTKRSDVNETPPPAENNIPADTFASVKAELAAMRAKAGEMRSGLRKVPAAGEGSATGPTPSSAADISSAAVAAGKARIDRLNAIRAAGGDASSGSAKSGSTDIGRRRQSADEKRRRESQQPRSPSSSSNNRRTHPQAAKSSTTSNSSAKQNIDDLPLKGQWSFCRLSLRLFSQLYT